MKKAGAIVSITFFVIAFVIFIVTSKFPTKSNVEDKDNNNQVEVVQTDINNSSNIQDKVDEKDNKVQEVQQTPEVQVIEETQTVQTQVVEKGISSVTTIDESDLSNLKGSHDVLAVISNKRVLLIDENTSGNDKKTLTYCFDVLTPDNNSLVLFVTKSVYDSYKVQDRLQVKYEVYTNDKGVEFPLVSLVTDVK